MSLLETSQYRKVKEFAAAKINISLAVGPLQPDGFHPIDSLVAFADIGDELEFCPASELELKIHGPFAKDIPADDTNLVIRAARLLLESHCPSMSGASIYLQKNLPPASGIGGGSADAAATLRGLNRLWSIGLSLEEMAKVGASLGSDIPVCVFGGAADNGNWFHMQGRGEQLQVLDAQPAFFALLVNPAVAVSTALVFAEFDKMIKQPPLQTVLNLQDCENDLTHAAITLAPEISLALQELDKLMPQKPAQMCGSGATCMARFYSQEQARCAAKALRAAYPHWWIKTVNIGASAQIDRSGAKEQFGHNPELKRK